MGNHSSKLDLDSMQTIDLSSYEDACNNDPDVVNFGNNVKKRTERVLNSLANGVRENSLSFESLKEATTSLLEMDQDVVELILANKKDVWKDRDLFELVEEFFENTLATLDFCSAMDKCIKAARDNQLIIQMALSLMPQAGEPTESDCQRILKELDGFLQAGNPFGEDFLVKFTAVRERHIRMLEKLQEKKRRLDKKMKSLRIWAKVSAIMFAALFAAVLICSVVAAAIAAPPVAGVLAVTSSLPHESLGRWIKSLWSGYETELKARREVVGVMHNETFVAIMEMDTIRVLVQNLETQIKSIVFDVKFSEERKDPLAIHMAMDDISRKRAAFVRGLDELEEHINRCGLRIRQARLIVLQKIIKHPER